MIDLKHWIKNNKYIAPLVKIKALKFLETIKTKCSPPTGASICGHDGVLLSWDVPSTYSKWVSLSYEGNIFVQIIDNDELGCDATPFKLKDDSYGS